MHENNRLGFDLDSHARQMVRGFPFLDRYANLYVESQFEISSRFLTFVYRLLHWISTIALLFFVISTFVYIRSTVLRSLHWGEKSQFFHAIFLSRNMLHRVLYLHANIFFRQLFSDLRPTYRRRRLGLRRMLRMSRSAKDSHFLTRVVS